MKLVGWTSLWAALMVGAAFAQVDMVADDAEPETQGATEEKVEIPSDVPDKHRVKEGETLWDITESYYGDPYRWPQIWSYNPEITNPHWIYPEYEMRLRPEDGEFVDTAPTGFKRASRRGGGDQAVFIAEYGYLNPEQLEDAGFIVGANEEHMMLVDTDVAYVRFKEGVEPEIGGVYKVYREMQEFEREGWERGRLVRILGELRLQDYDINRGVGRAVVIDAQDGLERGFRIAPLERQFYWVDVVPADRSMRATVVASLYPRKLPSTNQIVFVNAGAEHGVVLGNRFYIVRQGDEWRRSAEGRIGREIETTVPLPNPPKHYPWEVVALGRAVNVQPKTTAILLEKAKRAVRMGDRAELRMGE
jgi:hypothetical protein